MSLDGRAKRGGLLDRVGPGDFAVPLFIFATVAFAETSPVQGVARVIIVGVFILDLLAGRRLTFSPFIVAAGLFLLLSAASLAWTVAPDDSLARVQTFAFQFMSLLALMNLIDWKRARIELCLTWVLIGALAAGVQTLVVQGVRFGEDRVVEGALPPGQLALACAAGIGIAVYRFSLRRRAVYLVLAVILAGFLALTSGRRGLIITVVFLIVFLVIRAKSASRRVGAVVVGIVIVAAIYALITTNPFLYSAIGYRIEAFLTFASGDGQGDASVQGRSGLIDFGINLFQQAPILGNGIDSFRNQFAFRRGSWDTSADNNYVEILSDLGVIGFVAYYLPLTVFVLHALRGIGAKGARVQFAVAFVIAMASVDFSTAWIFSRVGVLMLGLCFAAVYYARDDSDRRVLAGVVTAHRTHA